MSSWLTRGLRRWVRGGRDPNPPLARLRWPVLTSRSRDGRTGTDEVVRFGCPSEVEAMEAQCPEREAEKRNGEPWRIPA